VDDVAAAVVDRALLRPEAAAPDEERVDGVDARRPERHEQQPRLEVDAAEDRAEHEDRRNRGEDELEVDERRRREVERRPRGHEWDGGLSLLGDVIEHRSGLTDEVAEEARAGEAVPGVAEAHVERPADPGDQDETEGGERQHHAVHRPTLLHYAAVEDDESGDAHQADERRRRELPGVVARVEPSWVWSPRSR
jgi:hypothetical protein